MENKNEVPKELTLPVDVNGYKKGIFYGKRGDKVTVVADRGNTYVVQNAKGESFPVEKSLF